VSSGPGILHPSGELAPIDAQSDGGVFPEGFGPSFETSKAQRHKPSGSFRHTLMYRPSTVLRSPAASGAVMRLVPYVYPSFPSGETTAESGVQAMWNPGMARLPATICRIASVPTTIGCPASTTRASGVQ